jgi:hypothetical protein
MTATDERPPVYGDVHNPADVEVKIEETKNRIAAGVRIITNREEEARKARREFDFEYALAIGRATGPAVNHKYQATIDTIEWRKIAEGAEIALHHAERTARALEKELFAWQSILNSLRGMLNAAGVR